VHDVDSLIHRGGKSYINQSVRLSNYVIVHNQIAYNELLVRVNKDNKCKIYVIPHGNCINLQLYINREDALKNFNLDATKKYLLFFGMIKKAKGLDVLINSMKDIPADIHLIIAGRTRDISFGFYQELIDSYGMSDRIHSFVRYITNDERNCFFNAADIVVLPYRAIYQSGILLMAMSYGKAVVASDLAANKMMLDNKNGILFNTDDSKDLAQKINMLLSDDDKRNQVSAAAKEYVTINNSWENIADAFYSILK
jgi:glycosyltransferase involved in cell wall biosynthesis